MKARICIPAIRLAICRRKLSSALLFAVMLISSGVCSILGGLLIEQEETLERTVRETEISCIGTSATGRANDMGVFSVYLDMLTGRRHAQGCYLERYVTAINCRAQRSITAPADAQLRLIYSIASAPELQEVGVRLTMEEGWGVDCLTGEERVCVITEALEKEVREENGERFLDIRCDLSGEKEIALRVVGQASGLASRTIYCPFYVQLDPRIQSSYIMETLSFRIKDNRELDKAKEELYTYFIHPKLDGLTEDSKVCGLIVQDEVYAASLAELRSSLGMLKILIPGLSVSAAILVCLTGYLTNRRRLREFAVLRCMGQKRQDIFLQVLLEQGLLILPGGLLGLAAGGIAVGVTPMGLWAVAACVAAGLLGSAGCALGICRMDPLKLMKAEE